MKNQTVSFTLFVMFWAFGPNYATGGGQAAEVPDFTQGAKIPEDAKHDWNLGATGLRGWMYCDKMVTSDARQIAITKVAKGSPAYGILEVGDVILGVGGKAFSYDPRTEMGKALTAAESEAGNGELTLSRWRAGRSEEVVVKIPVLGTYSPTAPYDCPKSKRILEQGFQTDPRTRLQRACQADGGSLLYQAARSDPSIAQCSGFACQWPRELSAAYPKGSSVGSEFQGRRDGHLVLRLCHDVACRIQDRHGR